MVEKKVDANYLTLVVALYLEFLIVIKMRIGR